jgi:Tol biopolymer transport system component
VTEGLGPSTNPWTSTEGRLVAFESTADLAGSQANTGTSRIYVYDTFSQTFARITNGPENCHVPSLHKVQSDWRIQYVCDGIPHFSMLRKDEHYEVPVPGGVTQRVLAMGTYFLVLSTTADLSDDSGTTAGNQIYLVNLYKRPAVPVPGATVWFPFQGVPPL